MSDSVKKWHEMQEDKQFEGQLLPPWSEMSTYRTATTPGEYEYKLQNTNDHIGRQIAGSPSLSKPSDKTLKEAYKILAYHNLDAIELAYSIGTDNE